MRDRYSESVAQSVSFGRVLARRAALAAAGLTGAAVTAGTVIGAGAWHAWHSATLVERSMLVPDVNGRYGTGSAAPVRLLLAGDSLAVGFGADAAGDTVGGRIAAAVSRRLRRPVEVECRAVVGARSRDLAAQLEGLDTAHIDVALIVVGSNDVLGMAGVRRPCRLLYGTVRHLAGAGVPVVVATCPDLGTLRLFIPPLRWLLGSLSRSMAAAQTRVVVAAGGRAVPLGTTLGALFWRRPALMFAGDRFHPSAVGYARAAAVVTPSVLAALAETARSR